MANTIAAGEEAVYTLRNTAKGNTKKSKKMSAEAREQALKEKKEERPDFVDLSEPDNSEADVIRREREEAQENARRSEEVRRFKEQEAANRQQKEPVQYEENVAVRGASGKEEKRNSYGEKRVEEEAETQKERVDKELEARPVRPYIQETQNKPADPEERYKKSNRMSEIKISEEQTSVRDRVAARRNEEKPAAKDTVNPSADTGVPARRADIRTASEMGEKTNTNQIDTLEDMNRITAQLQDRLAQAYTAVSNAKEEARIAQGKADAANIKLENAKRTAAEIEEKASRVLREYGDYVSALAEKNGWR